MRENKLVPKRRFKGFEEKYLKTRLDSLGNFGRNYSFSRSKEGDGAYHHVHYGDIHTKNLGVIRDINNLPSLRVDGNFELLKCGDIVIADASEDYKDLGKSIAIGDVNNAKIIAGLHTFKFTPNKKLFSVYYLHYSQSSIFRRFTYKVGTGISVLGISKDNLSKMKINLPSYKEQQKIGRFFQLLDQRIDKQTKKIAKLKDLKSAYLTEMFPQEDEAVPKRRFFGFKKKWRLIKLADIAPLRGGAAFPSNYFQDKGIPIVRISNILSNGTIGGRFVYFDEGDTNSNYLLKNKSILIAMSGATTGKVAILDNPHNDKFYQNQRVGYFEETQEVDYGFTSILVRTTSFEKQLSNVLVAGAQPNISAKQIGQFEFKIPSTKIEQQKIGLFFKNLDDQIKTENKKLAKLKAMKDAYLEEMFV